MEKIYPVLGHSMRFLLEPGDAVAAAPCGPEDLRHGDLALVVKWGSGLPSGYVIHRVVLNLALRGKRLVLTKGDANFLPDWPPSAFQAAGRVLALERGGLRFKLGGGFSNKVLLPLYSLAANKALYLAGFLAAALFSVACRLLPAPLAEPFGLLYLAWESRFYPALLRVASAPARPVDGIPARSAAAVKCGRILADETWSGTVTVADYLIVERGARVTVLPGTEVNFVRREPWFFPVLRAGQDGSLRELDSGFAKALVYGEFSARGSKAEPVRFAGDSFGGVHALGSGKVSFKNCEAANSGSWALSVRDSAFLALEAVSFSSCVRGVEASGQGAAFLKNCVFTGAGGPALRALDGAFATVSGGSVSGAGGPAFEISDSARAAFCGTAVTDAACAISASGNALVRAENCPVSGSRRGAVLLKGRASLEACGCSFEHGAFGLSAADRHGVRLSRCLFRSNTARAVSLEGTSSLTAADCVFDRNGAGVSAEGRSALLLSECSFTGNSGPGIELHGRNSMQALNCSFGQGESGIEESGFNRVEVTSASFTGIKGPAVCAGGAGELRLKGSSFTGNGSGLAIAGSVNCSAADCAFERQSGTDASFTGRARGRLSGCVFRRGGSALLVSGTASVSGEKCVFENNGGPAAETSGGGELYLEDCAASGKNSSFVLGGTSSARFVKVFSAGTALPAVSTTGGARLSAAGSSFSSVTDAVYCGGPGKADFSGCTLASKGGAALNLRRGAASLDSCALSGKGGIVSGSGTAVEIRGSEISAAAYGVDSCSSSFSARGLRVTGGEMGGIVLSAGTNRLEDVRAEGAPYPGISLAKGAALRSSGVYSGGLPWLPPAPSSAGPSFRRLLFLLAAHTWDWPVFSALYRLIYLSALPAARLLLRGDLIRALYLYRGMADKRWVPGLSDMDLACVLKDAAPAEDFTAYSGLLRRLMLLKGLFPFTGELMMATERDFSGFLDSWGVKGAEFPGASRLLSGRPVRISPAVSGAGLADATEAFYAYTLLLRHFFSGNLPEPFLRRNCLKNLTDVRRYLDTGSPVRLSRAAYAAAQGRPLESFMSLDKGEAAYLAFTALHAAAPGAGGTHAAPPPSPGPGSPGWFNSRAFNASCAALAERSGMELGVVLDSLYRVYVILPDAAAGDKGAYLRACGALAEQRAVSPLFSASPLVLTGSSFAMLSRLPYLNNPMLWADLPSASAGGSGPDDGGLYHFNLRPVPAPRSAAETRNAAGLAARHFCASWRSLWEEMPPHYFYTRTAGLRLLLETGESPGFSAPAPLREALLEKTGAAAPVWKEFLAGARSRPNYEYVSAQAAMLGRLADAG